MSVLFCLFRFQAFPVNRRRRRPGNLTSYMERHFITSGLRERSGSKPRISLFCDAGLDTASITSNLPFCAGGEFSSPPPPCPEVAQTQPGGHISSTRARTFILTLVWLVRARGGQTESLTQFSHHSLSLSSEVPLLSLVSG